MKKLQLGSCVYRVSDNGIPHAHFVITKPDGDPLTVLVVNITDYSHYDKTVILEKGHPAITKKSVVAYRHTDLECEQNRNRAKR